MTKHRSHNMAANSLAAYRSSDFSEREQMILRVLSESACPLTDAEVAERCGFGVLKCKVQPRISELVDRHILCQAGDVKCAETGKMVRTVAIAIPVQQALA